MTSRTASCRCGQLKATLARFEAIREDMTALRIVPPREYVGAIESVDEVVEFVQNPRWADEARRARP